MDNRSKWIWLARGVQADQYGEFIDTYTGKQATIRISADANYALYVNDSLVFAGQYADFPHYKVYDEIDLSDFSADGENRAQIVVWHHGRGTMGYYPGNAALRYEIWQGDALVCASDEHTLSRQYDRYVNGLQKIITGQLGFSYKVDFAAQMGEFAKSAVVEQDLPLFPRPCKRPEILPAADWNVVKNEGDTHFLIDLGRETAGVLSVDLETDEAQEILIAYGEHIVDGGVRRIIGSRDFSVEMRLAQGRNAITCPMRRLGLRYLEIFAQKPLRVHLCSVLPVEYPLEMAQNLPQMDETQKNIYDTCVRTLRMCMHEHYEDTPWREQALYAMDGRNQILCGYYAFKEFEFPRANLLLMSKDERRDGLLSICTPSSDDLTIPSFSLHYFTEIAEYTRYSGDTTLAKEVFSKLRRVLAAFTDRLEDGLVPVFTEKCHWNFYEWSEGLSGGLRREETKRFDAALNCLLAMALRAMREIGDEIGERGSWAEMAEEIARNVRANFFDENRGLYFNSTEDANASELVNALAILCGAAKGGEAAKIAKILADSDNTLTKATLSMLCFKYDALLLVDRAKYSPVILSEISEKYGRMLDTGATTFWETELGEADFEKAGSLCHGWSAMPVYYYHVLLGA